MSQYYKTVLPEPKPFVKWAGGKRQLISIISKRLPKKFELYHEPFLGGGAVLFHILHSDGNQKCIVSDLNSDLVICYITIRDKVNDLIEDLKNHSNNYFTNPQTYYYKIRDSSPKTQVEKASRLIFLNKTCFNGLYRVNSSGKFNVPLGRYSNPNIVNEDNLRIISQYLDSENITIKCQDFSSVMNSEKNDFIYFDPPYYPVSDTANFTSYTNKDFSIKDLERLTKICNDLHSKGCLVMLSNSDSPAVVDLFSQKHWKIERIKANRSINSNSNRRTGHQELLIRNY